MENGILIIDKPKDMTSRDVVNIVAKKLNTRHVGHTGTLDPLATGVLVIGVNNGCKIIDLLTSDDKEYIAQIIVGMETDTLDVTGKIIKSYNIENLSKEKVVSSINNFNNKSYLQEVPKYSAVHVNGKRLYEYARNNIDIELPKRLVEIKKCELVSSIDKIDNYYTFSIKVIVSKGTYIRSLIKDIGTYLGYPCTMKNLRRIRQGHFNIENSIKLDDIDVHKLVSIEKSLNYYDKMVVEDEFYKKVINGNKLNIKINNYTLMFDKNNKLLAIYMPYEKDKDMCKPYKVFGGN